MRNIGIHNWLAHMFLGLIAQLVEQRNGIEETSVRVLLNPFSF